MDSVDRLVFISYSRADALSLERLKLHLRPLARQAALDLWDDSRIAAGQSWHEEIAKALARARVAILLVSADFLASDFVTNNELPPLLHRAANDGLLILPLIVGPCLFLEHAELSRYQCVNSPDKPLSAMSPSDAERSLLLLARSVEKYFRLPDSTPTQSFAPAAALSPAAEPKLSSLISADGVETEPIPSSDRVDPSRRDSRVVDRPLNLSFDGYTADGVPVGWFDSFGYVTGVSTDYAIRVVRRSRDPSAGSCAVLERSPPAPLEFGSLMQRCPARSFAGKTLRLEGDLQTANVKEWAGLWLRADGDARSNLFFDNMSRRPVMGTTPWGRYFIDAPLPRDTAWLNYGIVLVGTGTVYVDRLRILVWSKNDRWEDV